MILKSPFMAHYMYSSGKRSLNNFYLQDLRFHTSFSFFWLNVLIFRNISKYFFLYIYLFWHPPPIVATPYFLDYYLNRLESARLHKDASIQVWEILSIFDKRKFYRIFSIYSSNFIPIVAPAYPLGPWIK